MARRSRNRSPLGAVLAASRPRAGDGLLALLLVVAFLWGQWASQQQNVTPAFAAGGLIAAVCASALGWSVRTPANIVVMMVRILRRRITMRVSQILKRKKATRRARIDGTVAGLDGFAFEAFCAARLEEAGWRVRITDPGPDLGLDLIARRRRRTVAIQCKHYNKPVGVSAVQEIVAARVLVDDGAEMAVISSRGFTRSAKALADANAVALVTHKELDGLGRALDAVRG